MRQTNAEKRFAYYDGPCGGGDDAVHVLPAKRKTCIRVHAHQWQHKLTVHALRSNCHSPCPSSAIQFKSLAVPGTRSVGRYTLLGGNPCIDLQIDETLLPHAACNRRHRTRSVTLTSIVVSPADYVQIFFSFQVETSLIHNCEDWDCTGEKFWSSCFCSMELWRLFVTDTADAHWEVEYLVPTMYGSPPM